MPPRIGTAGWALPRAVRDRFPPGDSNLARYAQLFNCVEINSTFYRPHRAATFARWAASVPADFRFAVKIPKTITHDARLVGCMPELGAFLAQLAPLDEKLGCLLVQLPGSLALEARHERFLAALRRRHTGTVVFEPRHASWFTARGEALLRSHGIDRVIADPAVVAGAAMPGGALTTVYMRLHGAPRIYWSAYGREAIARLSRQLARLATRGVAAWCVFDNTASGAATSDALALQRVLHA